MGRLQQVSSAFGLAACLAFGGGCIHVHTDADGKVKSVTFKSPESSSSSDGPKAPAGMKPPEIVVDHDVKPAGASIPAPATASVASMVRLTGKGELPKGAASEMALAWQNKVAYLNNPVSNGDLIPGLVGQLFLFGPGYQSATANGKLAIEMFDEPSGVRLGGWTLDKDALKKLVSKDERFGKCYTLFLPWPDYQGTAVKVKLTARYEGENSYPLYAKPSKLTLDPAADNTATIRHSQTVGANAGLGPIGAGFQGPLSSTPDSSASVPPLNPLPIRGRSATGFSGTLEPR
jgi:hypothetical protein